MPLSSGGNYPISNKLAWHGGQHIAHTDTSGTAEPVRAIADGEVVFWRDSNGADQAPLNYEGKTDNGCIVIKHKTEIGEGTEGCIEYYSIYMHLKQVFVKKKQTVYRKDSLGSVGACNGKNAMHLEIICDDENLRKIVGRGSGELDVSKNGRRNIVYGDIHFYLPSGTRFFSSIASNEATSGNGSPIYTSTSPLFVIMRFERGKCLLHTRQEDATRMGLYIEIGQELSAEDKEYEYNLYAKACKLGDAFHVAPSAAYELLRFGRVINIENETPIASGAVPHWHRVNYPGGDGWVDLNAMAVMKFSDGDFPHWLGWATIGDDPTPDSQCNSPTLEKWIKGIDEKLTENALSIALRDEEIQSRLSRTICKFPTEWERAQVDTRYSWLKKSSDVLVEPMKDEKYAEFKAYVEALSFWEEAKLAISNSHWHFHPREFIRHLGGAEWLSEKEWEQLIPKNVIRKPGSHKSEKTSFWESPRVSSDFVQLYYPELNKAMRKFFIMKSAMRAACFLGNAIQETQWLSATKEGGGRFPDLHKGWYGRGFLQLTNPDGDINKGNNNYYKYFSFCGRKNKVPPTQVELNWRDELASSAFHAANSAGAYWSWDAGVKKNSNIYADEETRNDLRSIATNKGEKYWYYSRSFAKCAASVNLPGQIQRDPPENMNGLVDRHVAYVNALMILHDSPIFSDGNYPKGFEYRRVKI